MIQFCLPSGSSRFQTDNNDSADVIVSVTVSNSDWMVCVCICGVFLRCRLIQFTILLSWLTLDVFSTEHPIFEADEAICTSILRMKYQNLVFRWYRRTSFPDRNKYVYSWNLGFAI